VAQTPVTVTEAVAAAERTLPAFVIARADSAAAAARVLSARVLPNPSLSLGYSRSPLNYHVEIEQPFVLPALRRARSDAAMLLARSAALGIAVQRARTRYDVEAAYANAATARVISVLSRENARDGDELTRIARIRRDQGDASDLDVDLAGVVAAQLHRIASIDSLEAVTAILALQSLMGLPLDNIVIAPADTFTVITSATALPAGTLSLHVAQLEADAAARALDAERRSRIPEIGLRAGFEMGDPTGDEKGIYPTVGVSIPLPIFDRHRGQIGEAEAARERALAVLEQTRREYALAVTLVERERTARTAVLAQDRAGLDDARRVAARALTAYREGAYPLASVLEAQRNARDALRQYYEDAGALWLTLAALTLAQTSGLRP
jgi:outer membrane protein, heavy metal efflux system